MVRATLRNLERQLVVERAEQRVLHCVDEFLELWELSDELGQPLPESLDFIGGIIDEGFLLPTFPKVINYIDDCRADGSLLDPKVLFRKLLPWGQHYV